VVHTYPRVCPRRAHDVAAKLRAAKPLPTRQSRRSRATRQSLASPRQSRQSRVMSRQSRARQSRV